MSVTSTMMSTRYLGPCTDEKTSQTPIPFTQKDLVHRLVLSTLNRSCYSPFKHKTLLFETQDSHLTRYNYVHTTCEESVGDRPRLVCSISTSTLVSIRIGVWLSYDDASKKRLIISLPIFQPLSASSYFL